MSRDTQPTSRGFRDLSIGARLAIGFGLLVVITAVVSTISYLASVNVTATIVRTDEVRVPGALVASRAQANLLRMLASTRGYLALGDPAFRESFTSESTAFRADLADLQTLSVNFSSENQARLSELTTLFNEWSVLPEQLFALRDDQLEREPAYKLLATDGTRSGGKVLIATQNMINSQKLQDATPENIALLGDIASFQGSFAALFSGLRSYVTTRNPIFKREYQANRTINDIAWENLLRKRNDFSDNQRALLDEIALERESFFELPDRMFAILESPQWRTDLALFTDDVAPKGNAMLVLLDEITRNEQESLRNELAEGRRGLNIANLQSLIGGILTLIAAVAMAVFFRFNIVGPIRRLTGVSERIREGDLAAQAAAESGDEIGTLATTFNRMTGQLRSTLQRVRSEKKRADDLLEVVIPIGVALSSERDFNRLLEKMLTEARLFCGATAGVLYLRNENDQLQYVIMQDELRGVFLGGTSGKPITEAAIALVDASSGTPNHRSVPAHVALTGQVVNIANVYAAKTFEIAAPPDYDETTGYPSLLTLPLTSSQGHVIGVLQLQDAQHPETKRVIPFDSNLQQLMVSFSSLAAAALDAYIRERSLRQEIRQLRIEIDEAKRQKQVSDIVDSDFFHGLQAKARALRTRRSGESSQSSAETSETDPSNEQPVGRNRRAQQGGDSG